jgi:hypothetical protein
VVGVAAAAVAWFAATASSETVVSRAESAPGRRGICHRAAPPAPLASLREIASSAAPVRAVVLSPGARAEAASPPPAPFATVPGTPRAPLAEAIAVAVRSEESVEDRASALDEISRSSDAGPQAVAVLARIANADPAREVRESAVVSLQHMALERRELVPEIRSALLDVAERSSAPERAATLEALPAPTGRDLDRTLAFLEDPDALVRAAVARPLRDVPTSERGRVAGRLEAALVQEKDAGAHEALAATLKRVASPGS